MRRSCWIELRSSIFVAAFLLVGFGSGASGEDSQQKIKLLSNEVADACIQDMACLQDLFLKATLGGASDGDVQHVFKWNTSTLTASLIGRQLPKDLGTSIDHALMQMSLLAESAGADIKLVGDGVDGVVNLVLLVSDDFVRDRDDTFSAFLSTVFAGQYEIYDSLSSGDKPVCQSQLFVSQDGSIDGGLALIESNEEAAGLRRCLHRTVLQTLGLRHPLPSNVDSMLNPESEREVWTSIDYLLLKLLYDPSVKHGMGKDDLAEIFPRLHQNLFRHSS